MNKIRNSIWTKRMSTFMAFQFLLFIFYPTTSTGLSSGPGQPELEGFSPAGVDNMVDLFTGDFSYNIPLLNVPGPDGGYPINLSYAAGIGMEQEASWVGLGWSLNPGAINRELRGLPDDFNGDEVVKEMSQKPNRTITLNVALKDIEAYGADKDKVKKPKSDTIIFKGSASVKLIYNNYTGFSMQPGIGFSREMAKQNMSSDAVSEESPEITDTLRSFQWSYPMASYFKKSEGKNLIRSFLYNWDQRHKDYFKNLAFKGLSTGSGLGFATSKNVSDISIDIPRESKNSRFNGKTGVMFAGVSADFQIDLALNVLSLRTKSVRTKAYGYLHSHQKYEEGNSMAMMDFSMDNQSLLTMDSRIIPMPIYTNDVFYIKGQGISGAARAYNPSLIYLSKPNLKQRSYGVGADYEFNSTLVENKTGIGGDITVSTSYSGDWKNGNRAINDIKAIGLERYTKAIPFVEKAFFKFKNEQTAETNPNTIFTYEKPLALYLRTQYSSGNIVARTTGKFKYNGSTKKKLNWETILKKNRDKKVKSFYPILEKDAEYYLGYNPKVYDLEAETFQEIPRESSDRIGLITVLNESGSRYIYGIPAENNFHKTAIFSIAGKHFSNSDEFPIKARYYSNDNSTSNKVGRDNFYSSTITPKHAHSWLLTEVVSPDYVDLGRDGPSPDDFGNYTSFEYDRLSSFTSRSPVGPPNILSADFVPGNYSDNQDDKGSVSYFNKDLYFVKHIKTKTHIAVFETKARNDGRGVAGLNDVQLSNKRLRSLERITLYSLDDFTENGSAAKPIKSVNFNYSYKLCSNVPNNAEVNGGKLTLESVWYSVGDERTKMSLSPYIFEYGVDPNYDSKVVNRWGSYQKPEQNKFGNNILYPYATATKAQADTNSYAWNLTKIKLPTGGEIKVSYESDDYGYVQNLKAQNMYKILGFTNKDNKDEVTDNLHKDNNFVVVQLNKQMSLFEAKKLLTDVKAMRFRAYLKYKKFPNNDALLSAPDLFKNGNAAYDFVDGYLEFDNLVELFNPSEEDLSDKILIKFERTAGIHPIQMAGLVDLKLNKTYLLSDFNFNLEGLAKVGKDALGIIKNIVSGLITEANADPFISRGRTKGWCEKIGTKLPSILRLNADDTKIGGGHRVKKIEISDEWAEMGGAQSRTYGQEYFYKLKDGSSSGVAQYEPSAGGEENPHRTPIRYSSDRLVFKDSYLHTELPIGESLFPSAIVGYSRVVVKNLANKKGIIVGAGIQEHEFYTAKDYPVHTKITDVQKVNTQKIGKFYAFLGGKDFLNPGFSQGFLVEKNDMHGKKKASATYAANQNPDSNDPPKQKVQYFYKTSGGYKEGANNRLNNNARVFIGDGISEIKSIGVEQDACVYLNESKVSTTMGGLKLNITQTIVPPTLVIVGTGYGNIDYSYQQTRTAALTKVISKTAILEKVVAMQDGAETITENIGFDAEIGAPILTSVTNEFDEKVYNYSQPAHWHYPMAQGAYKNLGLKITGSDFDSYIPYLQNGDMLQKGNSIIWVKDINSKSLVGVDGNPVSWNSLEDYTVVRSGFKNQQALQIGSIQSLYNPVDSMAFSISMLNAYNDRLPYTVDGTVNDFDFVDCDFGSVDSEVVLDEHLISAGGLPLNLFYRSSAASVQKLANLMGSDSIYSLVFGQPTSECFENGDEISFLFPINNVTRGNIQNFSIEYLGNGILRAKYGSEEQNGIVSTNWEVFDTDVMDCFGKCMKGILNVSATTLSDTLKSKFDISDSLCARIDSNLHRYGYRGLLKTHEQKYYPQKRLQTNLNNYLHQTKIDTDGEYEEFFAFRWGTNFNPSWETASKVVAYDQNGSPIEELDAIGNASTVLFGYERTLPTAVAGNSNYRNIGFDAFEDYPNNSYEDNGSHHLHFSSGVSITSEISHTGNSALKLNSSSSIDTLEVDGGDYVLFAWKKSNVHGNISYFDGSTTTPGKVISNPIEGWELIRLDFTANGSSDQLVLNGQDAIFDDIRYQPFNSSMKCFVYEKATQKTLAVLDENHFATIYNYDRDQVLVQVKKETERGIRTIQSTQRSTKTTSNN